MSEIVCVECGTIGERLAGKCGECGGAVIRHETGAEHMRRMRREAERQGLALPTHFSQTVSREVFEATRREFEERGILPRRAGA